MDIERFKDLAAAWGGDLTRWPDAERADAEVFCSQEPMGEVLLLEARKLDQLIEPIIADAPSDLLAIRIMRSFPKPAFDADWRRPAVAAAAALVIGLMGGFAGGTLVPVPVDQTDSLEYADAFDGLMEDWSAWEWSDA